MAARTRDSRTYFMVTNGYFNHPKVIKAGGDAALLDLAAMAYCSESTTDGHLPRGMVGRLTDRDEPLALASRLLDVARWHERGHDCPRCPQPSADEFVLHDYLEHQRSRAEIEDQRSKRKAAGQMGGLAKAANRRAGKEAPRTAPAALALASQKLEQTPSKSVPVSVSVSEVKADAPSTGADPQAKPKTKPSRGTRIPDGWWPDEDLKKWAREKCPNVRHHTETQKFVNYWMAKAGATAVKVRWDLTYKNWMTDAEEKASRGVNGAGRSGASVVDHGRLDATAENWGLANG